MLNAILKKTGGRFYVLMCFYQSDRRYFIENTGHFVLFFTVFNILRQDTEPSPCLPDENPPPVLFFFIFHFKFHDMIEAVVIGNIADS